MATRARIAIQTENGIIGAYQHWDGYPGGLGYNLIDNWYKADKITDAIKLGNSSKWGIIIGDKIDFDDRNNPMQDVQNVYYMRDRGEKDQGPKTYSDEADYLENGFNTGEDYIYLAKNTGEKDYLGNAQVTWFYASYDSKEFKPLEKYAILEHIDMLKRHLEMMEQRKAA
jgi:hypothetical protein